MDDPVDSQVLAASSLNNCGFGSFVLFAFFMFGRRLFDEFCKQFRYLNIADVDSSMDRRACSEKILKLSGIPASDFQVKRRRLKLKKTRNRFIALVKCVGTTPSVLCV